MPFWRLPPAQKLSSYANHARLCGWSGRHRLPSGDAYMLEYIRFHWTCMAIAAREWNSFSTTSQQAWKEDKHPHFTAGSCAPAKCSTARSSPLAGNWKHQVQHEAAPAHGTQSTGRIVDDEHLRTAKNSISSYTKHGIVSHSSSVDKNASPPPSLLHWPKFPCGC